MRELVGELVALVGGRNGNGISTNADFGLRNAQLKKPGSNGNGKRQVGEFVNRVIQGVKKKDVKGPAAILKEPKPEQVIPMEEGSFKEF